MSAQCVLLMHVNNVAVRMRAKMKSLTVSAVLRWYNRCDIIGVSKPFGGKGHRGGLGVSPGKVNNYLSPHLGWLPLTAAINNHNVIGSPCRGGFWQTRNTFFPFTPIGGGEEWGCTPLAGAWQRDGAQTPNNMFLPKKLFFVFCQRMNFFIMCLLQSPTKWAYNESLRKSKSLGSVPKVITGLSM